MPVQVRPSAPKPSSNKLGSTMEIAELRIHGFRGVQDARVRLRPHAVFIGPNNCGKTTIIEALALLFGRDRLIRDLTEHDFFGSDPAVPDRISIVATIVGFEANDPNRHPNWFREDRAVPKWLNPTDGSLHARRSETATELACQIGLAARFDRDDLAVDVIRYFHDDDDIGDVFDSEVVKRVLPQLVREMGFFLVPANRTWDRTISFGSELFRRVVSSIGGQPAAAVLAERTRLRAPERPLEADPGLVGIVGNVEAELKNLLGKAVGLKLRLTSTDSELVLDAVMPHYSIENRHQIPARRQGSGLVSLQHLLLLLHFGHMRAEQGQSFFLAMEEPELHVPPPLQRRLIHRIRSLSTQTIIATHSPIVAAGCDPTSVMIVHNQNGHLTAKPLLQTPITFNDPNWKRSLYLVKRQETVTALMHDHVLVPEGRTDFDLIQLMVAADETRRLFPIHDDNYPDFGSLIGPVPTHEGQVEGVFEELDKIHHSVVCLVDGDNAGNAYVRNLTALEEAPAIILQWPQNWTIEDAVGWIADCDAAAVLPRLTAALGKQFATIAALIGHMKAQPREGGIKGDGVAYEILIETLADSDPCLLRMRLLLRRLADACVSDELEPDGWARSDTSTEMTLVLRFVP